MNAIDVHTHVVPERFPGYAGRGSDPGWPTMVHDYCGHANVVIHGKNFRTLSDDAWNLDRRRTQMDAMQVQRQVLSPMPELLSHWMPAEDAAPLLRYVNEAIAGMVSSDTSRFIGLGAVPLQAPDLAIRELEHIMGALGLRGVEVAPNINGVPIGDARFDEFFAAVESLDASVFVHALRPVGIDRLIGPAVLEQLVAFPGEIGLGITSLMTGGMLERHPRLRLAASHGGGTLGLLIPRLQHAWEKPGAIRACMPKSPVEYARSLYYDSCVFEPSVLRYLVTSFGDDRVLIGTDYPFGIHERDPVGLLRRTGFDPAQIERMTCENAERFLGLRA